MIVSVYLIKWKQHSTGWLWLFLPLTSSSQGEMWVKSGHSTDVNLACKGTQGPMLPRWLLKTQEKEKEKQNWLLEPTSNIAVTNYRQWNHVYGSQLKAAPSCPKPCTHMHWGAIPKSCQLLQTKVREYLQVQTQLPINLDTGFL